MGGGRGGENAVKKAEFKITCSIVCRGEFFVCLFFHSFVDMERLNATDVRRERIKFDYFGTQ